jgi:Zn-dependent protease with chaperone function
LARALEKIRDAGLSVQRAPSATAHLWISQPSGDGGLKSKFANLFSTHPPINDRIKVLRGMISNV